MIPVHDSPRTSSTAWVNLSIIAINVVVFIHELSLGSGVDAFIDHWAVQPARVAGALAGTSSLGLFPLVTLVSAMFLHAGWLHIGGNMLFLWIFGDNVEDRLGHGPYLLFYLACGIAANLVQVLFDPTSTIPALGASGAIAGVLGAYAITFPGARVSVLFPLLFFFWIIEVPALLMIGLWFVTQLFSGVASLSVAGANGGGVAWWAHVGGFLAGIALMLLLPKRTTQPPIDWSHGPDRRAREDTGLIGLLIGIVSLASQLIQLAIGARVVARLLGLVALANQNDLIGGLIRLTNPLVAPFALVLPIVRLRGLAIDLPGLIAIVVYYLIGMAIISLIATAAYPAGAGRQRR